MLVLIVSSGRAGKISTHKAVPWAKLFVPAKEAHVYSKATPGIEIISHTANRIAATRQAALDFAGKQKVVLLDDDLTFLARCGDGSKFREITTDHKTLRAMFSAISTALNNYAHVGVMDDFMAHAKPRNYVVGRRYHQLLAYNPKLFPSPQPKFGAVELNEEHDFHLQLATRGLYSCVLTEWTKKSTYYADGGCQQWRTADVELAEHRKFAARWPGLVYMKPYNKSLSGYLCNIYWNKLHACRRGGTTWAVKSKGLF